MKSILMIVICCNADHNSFVTFNQFPPFEKKPEKEVCVQVLRGRLCEIISGPSPAKDWPRLCVLWKRGKSFWFDVAFVIIARSVIFFSFFACGKETNMDSIFLPLILQPMPPANHILVVGLLQVKLRTSIHVLFYQKSSSHSTAWPHSPLDLIISELKCQAI